MQRLTSCIIALCALVMLTITGCDNGSNLVKENASNPSPGAVKGTTGGTTSSGSGTVSPDNSKISYSAGPFAVPNVTGNAGDVQCGTGTPCNNFSLTVKTPAGYGSDHSLSIQIKWPNSAADFDLYVLNSSGDVIATSASTADPETIVLPPNSGNYTIRVVPYAPAGQSFTGTVQLKEKRQNPPPSNATPPSYVNYPAPSHLPGEHDSGEPSIGVNWNTGSVMYEAVLNTYRVKFDDRNTPATDSWTDVTADLPQCTAEESLDPILYTDHKTGRTYESQLAANPVLNSLSCFTSDDGDNWTPSEGGGFGQGVDHQTVGGGPFADNGVGPVTQYPDIFYYCSQDVATALCSVSRDGGVTFTPAVPIYTLEECGGLHGHVKVGPKGTAYVPNGGCGNNQAVVVSTDNGVNWTVRKDPDSKPSIGSDPGVEVGANGSVYFGYQNADGHARAAVSLDHGQTWRYDQDVGAQLGIKNTVFPTVIAGDDNRAAFAFLGTKTGGNYQANDFSGIWHLYVSTTYDGGKSWVTVDATPNDPVQRGPICTGGTTCSGARNLLDFIGIDVNRQGRVVVAYADGCTGACASGGTNNHDALATIARQQTGMRLFARFDPKADLTVNDISASGKHGKLKHNKDVTVNATVANDGKEDVGGVTVNFYDGTDKIGQTTVDLPAGSSTQTSITWSGKKKKGDHDITVVIDPKDKIAESDESNNKKQKTVTLK